MSNNRYWVDCHNRLKITISMMLVDLVLAACATKSTPVVLTEEGVYVTNRPTTIVEVTPTETEKAPSSQPLLTMTPIASRSVLFLDNWSPSGIFVTTLTVDAFRWGEQNDPHILNVRTGEDCIFPARSKYGLTGNIVMFWLTDDRMLVWADRVLVGNPCLGEMADITSTLPPGGADASFHLSPTRDKMLITNVTGRYIFSIDTGQTVLIDPRTAPDASSPYWKYLTGVAWSSDGSHVSMVTYPSTHPALAIEELGDAIAWVVDISSGTAQELTQWNLLDYGATGDDTLATWIDDTKLFLTDTVASGPYIFDIESGEAIHIPTALFGLPQSYCVQSLCDYYYYGRVKQFSGDALNYYVLLKQNGSGSLKHWLYNSQTGEIEQLPDMPDGSEDYFFSPNGSWLVSVHHDLSGVRDIISVRLTDAHGNQFTELYTGNVRDAGEDGRGGGVVFFGENDEYLGISERQFTIFEMSSGTFRSHILFNLEEQVTAYASPDGTMLLVGGLTDTSPMFLVPANVLQEP